MNTKSIMLLVALVMCGCMCIAGEGEDDILGMIGLTPVTESSYAAVWVPIEEGSAVAAIRWYNNDCNVVFPEVLLASGTELCPVNPIDAILVAENVQGPSLDWGEVLFDQAYGCESDGLYCIFRLPEGSEYIADGTSGGAAFGYSEGIQAHLGWIGGEDAAWLRIAGEVGLAIDPIFVPVGEDTELLKNLQGQKAVPSVPQLLPAHPNPFNPQTVLEYSLPSSMKVKMAVYDVRGRLVRHLVSGMQPGGWHEVLWRGADDHGRRVSSGVYLIQFTAGRLCQTQRVLLVK